MCIKNYVYYQFHECDIFNFIYFNKIFCVNSSKLFSFKIGNFNYGTTFLLYNL